MITKDQLLEFGMVMTDNPAVPMKKVIGQSNTDELSDMLIAVTMYTNSPILAIILPDGGMLTLNPKTIKDLKKIEELIMTFEPVF